MAETTILRFGFTLVVYTLWFVCKLSDCQLTVQPTSSRIEREGTSPMYTCRYDTSMSRVQWLDRNDAVINTSVQGFRVEHNEKVRVLYLTFVNISYSMSGRYVCRGYDKDNKSFDEPKQISVYVPLKFVDTISPQAFERGEDAVVTCKVKGIPEGQIEWEKDGVQVDETSEKIYLDSNSSLVIKSVQKADEGSYTCRARETSQAQNIGKVIFVDVEYPPGVIKSENPVVGVKGSNITLTCTADAEPKPTFKWYRGAVDDMSDNTNMITKGVSKEGNLIIENANENDAGNYTCVLSNPRGNQSSVIEVIVHVPPSITTRKNATVKDGTRAEIRCVASGIPKPDAKIYRNNELVEEVPLGTTSTVFAEYNESTATVVFDPASFKDAGMYECRANSSRGASSATLELKVLLSPNITDTKNDSVKEGGNAAISCAATGVPQPTVRIFKGDELVDTAETIGSRSTITFNPATYTDAGDYLCLAENSAGETKATLKLNVEYSPRDTILPSVYACPNQETVLECEFDAYPEPDLVWSKMASTKGAPMPTTPRPAPEQTTPPKMLTDSKSPSVASESKIPAQVTKSQLSENSPDEVERNVNTISNDTGNRRRRSVMESLSNDNNFIHEKDGKTLKLRILNVDERSYGKYYCQANNSEGNNTASVELKKAMRPGPPTNVKVSDLTTGGALVTFSQPLNAHVRVISYEVKAVDLSNKTQDEIMVSSPRHATLRKLQHNTRYSVIVTATNCIGKGVSSEPKSFSTLAIDKPNELLMTSPALSDQMNNYNLTWKTNGNGGGTITNITITYKPTNAEDSKKITKSISNTDPEFASEMYSLSDLEPGTAYDVTLTVYNEVGGTETKFKFTTADSKEKLTGAGFDPKLIIIIIVVIVVLLIVLDVVCCATRQCGLFHCIFKRTCAATPDGGKAAEEGSVEFRKDNKADEVANVSCTEKQPLAEGAEPIANGNEPDAGVVNEETPLHNDQSHGDDPVTQKPDEKAEQKMVEMEPDDVKTGVSDKEPLA